MKKKAYEIATETDVAMMDLMGREMPPAARALRERVIWRRFENALRDSSELRRRFSDGAKRFEQILHEAQEWCILPLDVLAYCEDKENEEIVRLVAAGASPSL